MIDLLNIEKLVVLMIHLLQPKIVFEVFEHNQINLLATDQNNL